MLKYFISILLLSLSFQSFSQDDDDSVAVKTNVDSMGLIRFSIDISKPIFNSFSGNKKSYEFEVDYYWKKNLYIVAEFGFGSSRMDDTLLNYSSTNSFYKAGLSKNMLGRNSADDWDMAFIGFRYGFAPIKRTEAFYTTHDNFWGITSGTIPGDNMMAHWMEVCAGVQLELYKGIFAGWTVSGKFLMNKKQFLELPPSYIAGYGKGDNNTIFNLNFYVGYAIKWKKELKNPGADTAAPK